MIPGVVARLEERMREQRCQSLLISEKLTNETSMAAKLGKVHVLDSSYSEIDRLKLWSR